MTQYERRKRRYQRNDPHAVGRERLIPWLAGRVSQYRALIRARDVEDRYLLCMLPVINSRRNTTRRQTLAQETT